MKNNLKQIDTLLDQVIPYACSEGKIFGFIECLEKFIEFKRMGLTLDEIENELKNIYITKYMKG